ncbi:hypothetical protein [Aquimarina algiphila]|nr:hypothetical protein [Aquimarina algiphila]
MLWIFITNTAGNITYIYDATGAKLKKIAPASARMFLVPSKFGRILVNI